MVVNIIDSQHESFFITLDNGTNCWSQTSMGLLHLLSASFSSCLHTTSASLGPQNNGEILHTVPHSPRMHNSTRPSNPFSPSINRTADSLQPVNHMQHNLGSYSPIHKNTNLECTIGTHPNIVAQNGIVLQLQLAKTATLASLQTNRVKGAVLCVM